MGDSNMASQPSHLPPTCALDLDCEQALIAIAIVQQVKRNSFFILLGFFYVNP
jgi:hypothetical protein